MKEQEFNSFEDMPMTISVSQLAKVLSISRTSAYQLTEEKDFPSIKIKGRTVIFRDELIKWKNRKLEEKKK